MIGHQSRIISCKKHFFKNMLKNGGYFHLEYIRRKNYDIRIRQKFHDMSKQVAVPGSSTYCNVRNMFQHIAAQKHVASMLRNIYTFLFNFSAFCNMFLRFNMLSNMFLTLQHVEQQAAATLLQHVQVKCFSTCF